MAEGLARQMFGDAIEIGSAALEPGTVHPLAIETMAEINIDISHVRPRPVDESVIEDASYLIFTSLQTGDLESKDAKMLVWPIPDPTDPPASPQELQARFRDTRIALTKHLKGLDKILNI